MTPQPQQQEYIITEEDIQILEDSFGVTLIIPRARPHTPTQERPRSHDLTQLQAKSDQAEPVQVPQYERD